MQHIMMKPCCSPCYLGTFTSTGPMKDDFSNYARLCVDEGVNHKGGNSLNSVSLLLQVRKAFDFAYQQLSAPAAPGEAILHRVIRCACAKGHHLLNASHGSL